MDLVAEGALPLHMHREIHTAITAKLTCNCQQLVLKILSWELNGLDITLEREISTAVTKHEVFPRSSLKIKTSRVSRASGSQRKVPVGKKSKENKSCV